MNFTIKTYDPSYIEKQVELIWEVSGKWKYPYATSVEQIKKAYSLESFDPRTRFYAFDGNDLIGYVTSSVHESKDKGVYATLRFPVVIDNEVEITDALMSKVLEILKEFEVSMIRAPAANGLGNTLELANKYNFERKSKIFIRAKEDIKDLNISNNTDDVIKYNDEDHRTVVKELFKSRMGMDEEQGIRFFKWAISNKERKETNDPNLVNWNIYKKGDSILGFSYFLRSDRQPNNGELPSVWVEDGSDTKKITDKLISDHIESLKPSGLEYIGTFLDESQYELKGMYNEFGFKFDAFYSYQKIL